MSLLADLLDPERIYKPLHCVAAPIYKWSLLSGIIPHKLLVLPPDPWTGDAGRGRWLISGILDCDGTRVSLTQDIWSAPETGLNKDYQKILHRFEWLRDLRAVGGDAARRHGRSLIESWCMTHELWQAQSWELVTTAHRVTSWFMGYEFFCSSADDRFLERFFRALVAQVRHVERVDPKRIIGIDGLVIIQAFVISGLCLEGGERRLEQGLAWLDVWLDQELDADGMHVSRSPSAALEVARRLIEMRVALVRGGYSAPLLLQNALDRLAHVLKFFKMPDGKLAVFNGGLEDSPLLLEGVFRTCGIKIRKPLSRLYDSGYEALNAGRTQVVMDMGICAEAPYDRGAHAGPLAFEMSVGRDRMIINCGSHAYDSEWAKHLRVSAAHSTLTLDDRNAFEIKDDGHIGRQSRRLKCQRDQTQDGGIMLTGAHDGYAPLNGLVHTRRLYVNDVGSVLKGEDTLVSDAPLVKPVTYAVRFHLHPKVQVSLIQDGQAALLRLPSGSGWRFQKNQGQISLEPSIYAGGGGQPRKTMQIVLSGTAAEAVTRLDWEFVEEGGH